MMMNKDEAVQKLSKVARISVSYAEDLYDSFFPKPVVPQYVADWYEEHKDDCDYELWDYFSNWDDQEDDDFKNWVKKETEPIITIVNMNQFGYEVEEEPRYTVKLKKKTGDGDYLVRTGTNGLRFYNNIYTQSRAHTRKELEDAGFGWVFNCEGIEIEEVE